MVIIPLLNPSFLQCTNSTLFLKVPDPFQFLTPLFSAMKQGVLVQQERDKVSFRNTSHPARVGGKKTEIMKGSLPVVLQCKGISCSFQDPCGKLKMNLFALWIFNSEVKQVHV